MLPFCLSVMTEKLVTSEPVPEATIFPHRKNLKLNAGNMLVSASGLSHFRMEIQTLIFMRELKHW